MKQNFKLLIQYLPWLLLIAAVDCFAAFLLWLSDAKAFFALLTAILLASLLFFAGICIVLVQREKNRWAEFFALLQNPNVYQEETLKKMLNTVQADAVRALADVLRQKEDDCGKEQAKLTEYEKYVEAWAHEIKTPLSLLTFLLDNRRDELPETVSRKLNYIRNRMQGYIDQMLFYARLKGMQKDYLFEHMPVLECIEEVLEDYRPLLEEKRIRVFMQVSEDASVYSDCRGLRFLLGQLVSNAVKYSGIDPEIRFAFVRQGGVDVLLVRDNGIGIKVCDLPYIFAEGFTGDSGEGRKQATGMGLYLAKEMAGDLKLTLTVESEWGKGTEIRVAFPVVEEK